MRCCAFLLALFATSAWSHDLWLDKETNGYVLHQGHRHASHDGADLVPYEPKAAKRFTCLDRTGEIRHNSVAHTYPARYAGNCATLYATFSTGYWTKTAWDTRNLPKTGIAGVLKSWHSEESLKLIDAWTARSDQPFGSGLEITPTTNPLALRPGDKLVVLVTEDGKPSAGIAVAYAGDTRGATGADGKVAIRLRRAGLQLIQASLETPLSDGKADFAIRSAALQFEIAP